MKQKLLLALFVLFASVGAMRAAGTMTLKVPSQKGKVTVQLIVATSATAPTVTASAGTAPAFEGASTTKTLTIPNNTSAGDITYTLTDGSFGKVTVTGLVEEIGTTGTIDAAELIISSNGLLTTLDVSSTTSLTKLTCSNNQLKVLDVNALSDLTYIDCSNNKIATFTPNGNVKYSTLNLSNNSLTSLPDLAAGSNSNYGEQYIDLSTGATKCETVANAWFDVTTILSGNYGLTGLFSGSGERDACKYSFTSSEAKNRTETPLLYKFHNGTNWKSGVYRCKITNTKRTNVTYNVDINVKPAAFAFATSTSKTSAGVDHGTLTVTPTVSNATVYEGDKITLSAAPTNATQYAFDNFELVGFNKEKGTTASEEFTVTGKIVDDYKVSAKAIFKAKQYSVTLTSVKTGGTYTVVDANNNPITDGKSVDYGTKLEIKPVADEAFSIGSITVDGDIITPNNNGKYIATLTANTIIAVTFTPATADVIVKIVNYPTTNVEIKVNGTKVDNTTPWEAKVNSNSSVSIRAEVASAASFIIEDILINGISASNLVRTTPAGSKEVCVATFTAPQSGTIPVEVKTKQLGTLTPTFASEANAFTYDGKDKKAVYTTGPVNVTDLKLTYQRGTGAFTATLPKNAGTYNINRTREQDSQYNAITALSSGHPTLVINRADVNISIPTVSVVTASNGIKTYSISNPVAKAANTGTSVEGTWAIKSLLTGNSGDEVAANILSNRNVPDANQAGKHQQTFTFIPKDYGNYNRADVTVSINVGNDKYTEYIVKAGQLPTGVKATVMNGGVILADGAKVVEGTTLTFLFEVPAGVTITKVYEDNASKTDLIASYNANNNTYTMGNHNIVYKVETTGTAYPSANFTVTTTTYEVTYDGSVKPLLAANYTITPTVTPVITYKQGAEKIELPINAGDYTVVLTIPAQVIANKSYAEKIVETTMTIKKATPDVTTGNVTLPSASKIGKGAKLSTSVLSGGSVLGVAGTFEWKNGDKVPSIIDKINDEYKYPVVFKPTSTQNYNTVDISTLVKVEVSDKPILTYTVENGTILIKDAIGKRYVTGDEVQANTKLTITTEATTGFVLDSYKINDTNFTGTAYTMPDKSVDIQIVYKLKSADPSALKVTFTKTGKGFTVDKTDAVVKFKDNFSFTVKTAAADKDKVVVKGGATVLKANGNGTYTLSAMTKDTVISISLATPTKLKVAIEKETKNAKGTKMGKVQIQGVTADSTYYYGDVLTLTAFPESGVSFHSWSDSNTDNPRTYMVTTATALKPSFTGTPTGIADIEGTKVYGAEGYIYVSCEGQATVTVVTMDGRSQQVRIAGEARIETGAGIYGVILQQGTEVLKTKVVVR